MNIILSLLFAIKIFYPVQVVLPNMETSFQDIKSQYKVFDCLDDDNQDCLWNIDYSVERDIPYKTIFYFNDDKKLIQISITYYNKNKADEYKLSSEFLNNIDFQQAITIDEKGNVVSNMFCCQPIPTTNYPPKKGFIPKLPELK